ncbi:RNA polymerase sigma factor [Peteryoungia algae]|uniref:RNA polymerase sigma factor n=1 Tax=Peteryoungia algae TaxID=2919917 RepID=A0ABT0D4J4_9HYPH|nr:RNA polymerase sigma factor [Rhizobium sp. SSM4.3]MCJ8240224.1 RNA polymerase sigma factor [Rhizobium sp. SSM4.3]
MQDPAQQIETVYRQSAPRIRAALIRLLGSFDLAEEALHDAFLEASREWPTKGMPRNPVSWLVSAGRFRTIDRLRKRALLDRHQQDIAYLSDLAQQAEDEPVTIDDDMLRLIFTCCHPALPEEARIALALREVCGLTTEEIARAFLGLPATIAQRIVRAKARIRDQRIPYTVPEGQALEGRLETVLAVIYLLFNEGHMRAGAAERLCEDAIHLGRLVASMLPDAEALGLLALMLIQQSRRHARLDARGDLVLLADQDRDLWDRSLIAEGEALLCRIHAAGEIGAYGLQASIALCHALSPSMADTDWRRIVSLYDLLLEASPSPVVRLNRAVALAEVEGPSAGLLQVETLLADPLMQRYSLAHSVAADLLRRLGRVEEARQRYKAAQELTAQAHEVAFIEARLRALNASG